MKKIMERDKCSRDQAYSKTMKSGPAEYKR